MYNRVGLKTLVKAFIYTIMIRPVHYSNPIKPNNLFIIINVKSYPGGGIIG